MRIRSVLLITALGLIAAPAAAPAATPARLPVLGAADGVQVAHEGGDVVLRFTGASATAVARYAGRRLELSCETQPPPGLLFSAGRGSASSGGGAPLERQGDGSLSMRTSMAGRFDVCSVPRSALHRPPVRRGPFRVATGESRPPLARVALTPAGAQWIEELGHVQQLDDAIASFPASAGQRQTYPLPGATPGTDLVTLDGPDASPPAGQVGYWSDGGARAVFATLSAAGRRLLVEDLGGGMMRTNLGSSFSSSDGLAGTPTYDLDIAGSDPDATKLPAGHHDSVDEQHGVRAGMSGTRMSVRFTGRARAAYARIAGRRVSITCVAASVPVGLLSSDAAIDAYQLVVARVPRRGDVIRVRVRPASRPDICALTDDGRQIATFAPTAAGRVEELDLRALFGVFAISSLVPEGATAYPTAAAIVVRHPKLHLLALAGPDARVPTGRVGVWTDVAQQALVATTSASGHRLVLADEGNGVLRTNLSMLSAASLLVMSFDVG